MLNLPLVNEEIVQLKVWCLTDLIYTGMPNNTYTRTYICVYMLQKIRKYNNIITGNLLFLTYFILFTPTIVFYRMIAP